MIEPTTIKRVYGYQTGDYIRYFMSLMAAIFGLFGLLVLFRTMATGGAFSEVLVGVVGFVSLSFVSVLVVYWLRIDGSASQSVAFHERRVQLPLTKGDSDDDFLLFANVIGLKVDRDYHEHGPALIVSTPSKPVAYKSMYFESIAEFNDFCSRFERAIATAG